MNKIDEWNPVYPKQLGSSTQPPNAAGRPAQHARNLVGTIRDRLFALEPRPAAVHFYRGEGLRWIRVGFEGRLLEPADVEVVGEAIRAGLGNKEQTLYFHALRPYDLLFFLEHYDDDSTGMPPEDFGSPLDDVLRAWWPRQAKAGKKKA